MEYRELGRTGLKVSAICLGTMTWGEQNTEAEAHQQMDYALERGVNFWDAAEMYPVPPKAETQGRTEQYIGSWLAKSGKRDKVIIATKVTGRSQGFEYLGRGETRLSRAHIKLAVENNLKRLRTDYIDLYQMHWPDRTTNYFGQLGYRHVEDKDVIDLEESLGAMAELMAEGKIRHVGLSNETPWGVMHALKLAETKGLPRVASVQNPYNLLNRSYEVGLAEVSIREQCGLLAYSPLAFGVLSGKYLNGQRPPKGRITLFARFQRYNNPLAEKATAAYAAIAKKHGLDMAQMALAYVTQQPFVTSNIIGATTMEQLKSNVDSMDLRLSPEVLQDIEVVQVQIPNPCP
ncbi:NADP(H)-dependent aldo-keto reductase [bacterium]|nr:NADP(H)-dependent aldo-keto reductase [bacterium]